MSERDRKLLLEDMLEAALILFLLVFLLLDFVEG
jgi:hypothetical protein